MITTARRSIIVGSHGLVGYEPPTSGLQAAQLDCAGISFESKGIDRYYLQ